MNADEIRARLARLKTAADSGVLTIQHGDTRTTFRNLDDLEKRIRVLEADLAAAGGKAPRRRVFYVRHGGKGY